MPGYPLFIDALSCQVMSGPVLSVLFCFDCAGVCHDSCPLYGIMLVLCYANGFALRPASLLLLSVSVRSVLSVCCAVRAVLCYDVHRAVFVLWCHSWQASCADLSLCSPVICLL